MANPVVTVVTKGGWVKVATNVTCVGIWMTKQSHSYSWTYRLTGGGAPTLATEQVKLEYPGRQFNSGAAFDLYIWCKGEDGSVRVDVDFQAEYLIDA